jgi:hypothetical protein
MKTRVNWSSVVELSVLDPRHGNEKFQPMPYGEKYIKKKKMIKLTKWEKKIRGKSEWRVAYMSKR